MSLFSQLKNIQWKQLQHDEKYHKDICLLPVQRRITHMVLHLSKYSAKIIKSAATEDTACLKKSLIDSLIIIFSSANIFGHLIGSKSNNFKMEDFTDLTAASHFLLRQHGRHKYSETLELAISIVSTTGNMCKTVESLDHLEAYPFREITIEHLDNLFELILALSCASKIADICEEISNRLYAVEKKHLYFEELGNYKEGYR